MQVQALLKKASTLPINTICPLHGPVLAENLAYYIEKYTTWSSYAPEDTGILIAYASIHGHTAQAAAKLKELLESKGAPNVHITDLCRDDIHKAVENAFRYSHLVLASATYDGGIFPAMENFLYKLKSKNYQNRTVGIIENGSWAPMAAKCIKSLLETMKNITVAEPVVSVKSALKPDNIPQLETLADNLISDNQIE